MIDYLAEYHKEHERTYTIYYRALFLISFVGVLFAVNWDLTRSPYTIGFCLGFLIITLFYLCRVLYPRAYGYIPEMDTTEEFNKQLTSYYTYLKSKGMFLGDPKKKAWEKAKDAIREKAITMTGINNRNNDTRQKLFGKSMYYLIISIWITLLNCLLERAL